MFKFSIAYWQVSWACAKTIPLRKYGVDVGRLATFSDCIIYISGQIAARVPGMRKSSPNSKDLSFELRAQSALLPGRLVTAAAPARPTEPPRTAANEIIRRVFLPYKQTQSSDSRAAVIGSRRQKWLVLLKVYEHLAELRVVSRKRKYINKLRTSYAKYIERSLQRTLFYR